MQQCPLQTHSEICLNLPPTAFYSSETGVPLRGLLPTSFVQRSQGGGGGGNLARSETCSGGLLQEQRASCLKRRARMCRSCFSEQMFARWACLLKALTAGTLLWVALSWHQRYWREDLTVDLWSQSGPILLFHALGFDHRAYWWVISDYIVLWIELRCRKYVLNIL